MQYLLQEVKVDIASRVIQGLDNYWETCCKIQLHVLLSFDALLLAECLIGGNGFHLVSKVWGLAVSHLCEMIIFILYL